MTRGRGALLAGAVAAVAGLLAWWGVSCFLQWSRPLVTELHLVLRNAICTVYFTPVEGGYAAPRFSASSVHVEAVGRELPGDFLRAIRMEGFGRLASPVDGKSYLHHGGDWKLADEPLGRRSMPLVPHLSCAASETGPLRLGDTILVRGSGLPRDAGLHLWRVDDVGPGLEPSQVDLYWGEAVSAGPGAELYQPVGIEQARIKKVAVYRVPEGGRVVAVLEPLRRNHLGLVADALLRLLPLEEAVEGTKPEPKESP